MTPGRLRSSANTSAQRSGALINLCHTRLLRAFAALAIAAWALGACGSCQGPPGDPRTLVPTDADGAIVIPSIEKLRANAHGLLSGVEGGVGVLDLLTARFGVDLTTDAGLGVAGVHGDGAAVLFTYEEATVVAVGVTDAARFEAAMAHQVHKAMGGREEEVRMSGLAGAAASPERDTYDWPLWRVIWGTTPDAIGWVIYTAGDADPQTLLREMGRSGRAFFDREGPKHAQEIAGSKAVLWAAGRFVLPLPRSLGLARLAIRPVSRRLSDWRAAFWIDPSGLRVEADVRWRGKDPMPVAWAVPEGSPVALHEVVPRQVTAVFRGRVDPRVVDRLPKAVRKRLPRLLPFEGGASMPSVQTLLGLMQGDLALVALGIDGTGTLDDLIRAGGGVDAALQLMHMALVVKVRDADEVQRVLAESRLALEQVGWTTADVKGGGWRGVAFVKEGSTYTMLQREDLAVLVSGEGEVARWLDRGQGRGMAIGDLVEAPIWARALGGEGASTLGGVANFARVTRELADKGMPPYFLKILADIRTVVGTVDLSGDGASVVWEVRL